MRNFKRTLRQFDYKFPKYLIANKPCKPRDSSRLLVYNRKTKKINFDIFKNLGKYLPKNCLLVLNETKVIPARLILTKPSGGKIQALYIHHDSKGVQFLVNRELKPDLKLTLNKNIYFTVVEKMANGYLCKPSFPAAKTVTVLNKFGKTPLPPYIKNVPLKESLIKKEYQTVFARQGLSVAAPTASLHFTKNLIRNLKEQGIEVAFVNLNVNLGTFTPLIEEHLKTEKLHSEFYTINRQAAVKINRAKRAGKPIIAAGTTVVRTLESAVFNGELAKLSGNTSLFISPGYKFQMVDGLITNFHVPKSSLLMLVCAFAGRTTVLKLYKKAISRHFRLFSFGDGMLIT